MTALLPMLATLLLTAALAMALAGLMLVRIASSARAQRRHARRLAERDRP